jgi:hypothetical protein
MKPQDIFGVILRSVALWLCVWGAWNTIAGIKYLLPTINAWTSGITFQHDSFGYFIYSLPALLSGLIILRFAEFFVSFTYPRQSPPPLPDLREPSTTETHDEV